MVRSLPLVLVFCLVLCCCCTQPATRAPVTPPPAPVLPETTAPVTVNATTAVPPEELVKVSVTGTPSPPPPDPTDITAIRFSRYADNDFSIDYPSGWNISESVYYATICHSTETQQCYETEIRTIGPFDFKEKPLLKRPARIVTFTSADKRLRLTVFTADFIDNMDGNLRLNPVMEWAKNILTEDYPDVSGANVGDYTYSSAGNTMMSGFTVIMPAGSKAYPLAYRQVNYVTVHRVTQAAFLTDNANLANYRDLEERMLSSIAVHDP